MKKKKKILYSSLGFLAVLVVLSSLYFGLKRRPFNPDFTFNHLPRIAGISTVIRNYAQEKTFNQAEKLVRDQFKEDASPSADQGSNPPALNLNKIISSSLAAARSSLVDPIFQRIGYVPLGEAPVKNPTPCQSNER